MYKNYKENKINTELVNGIINSSFCDNEQYSILLDFYNKSGCDLKSKIYYYNYRCFIPFKTHTYLDYLIWCSSNETIKKFIDLFIEENNKEYINEFVLSMCKSISIKASNNKPFFPEQLNILFRNDKIDILDYLFTKIDVNNSLVQNYISKWIFYFIRKFYNTKYYTDKENIQDNEWEVLKYLFNILIPSEENDKNFIPDLILHYNDWFTISILNIYKPLNINMENYNKTILCLAYLKNKLATAKYLESLGGKIRNE